MLQWDQQGEKTYETGISKGVFYPKNKEGVAWSGLIGVTEKPTGAESVPLYADNIKYLELIGAEEFEASLEAFTYPEEFAKCDGSAMPVEGVSVGQQTRMPFDLSYQTIKGNDEEGGDYGYLIHLVWNATVAPSERAYKTVNNTPEAVNFSWELKTTPVAFEDGHRMKPTSFMTIDSTKFKTPEQKARLVALEAMLYGSDIDTAMMPTPTEVIEALDS